MIYTAFCRDKDRQSTWIQRVSAKDQAAAKIAAVKDCANDWEMPPEDIECFALAAGDIQILEWED